MAFEEQQEPSLPNEDESHQRETSNHLPRFFRTEFNRKFLNATLDQMVTPGQVEKLTGFYGRKNAKAYTSDDSYVGDVTKNREDYQFEPVTVIKDGVGNVDFYSDYNDYINSINILKGNTNNHSKLNSQEYYAWNPRVDWDKLINFREYYWLPNGPEVITVVGQTKEIESTYDVKIKEEDEGASYLFTPNGLTTNPTITLYRGQTYRFEIDTPSFPLAFVTKVSFVPGQATLIEAFEGLRRPGVYDYLHYDMEAELYDSGGWVVPPREGSFTEEDQENASLLYRNGLTFFNADGVENPNIVFLEKGVIEFKVPETCPDVLYYVSKDDANVAGMIKIFDIIEATEIDVGQEIIGKKDYKTTDGWNLSNGMKLEFAGNVFPEKYGEGEWYVEGVGDRIELINRDDLELSSHFVEDFEIQFDNAPFDFYPFSEAMGYPQHKDYIVINRASKDGNAWSKHNRWFHIDVIEQALRLSGQIPSIDQDARARRPIIEFDAGLKLHKFGSYSKKPVDLVDTHTRDAFSLIEGSVGYNVDTVDLTDGMRVLFLADNDSLVKGKIFKITFIVVNNVRQITLTEEKDTYPLEGETVLVTKGEAHKGKFFYYNGTDWKVGQAKEDVNQSPLFELYSPDDVSFIDPIYFKDSQFQGNKIFSYKEGDGADDNELGFPLCYQNISNSGDILFEFDLANGEFVYTNNNQFAIQKTDTAFLRKYRDRETYESVNGWENVEEDANQIVIQQFTASGAGTDFPIDVYDDLSFVENLWLRVYVNNKIQILNTDYETILNVNGNAYIRITYQLNEGDVVLIKTRSDKEKNDNGFYEIPYSLERNPKNDNIKEFTLGEVMDHAITIVEEDDRFSGTFPGNSNLRDLGSVAKYGRKFLKHSVPFNLPVYHLLNTNSDVISAIQYASKEYAKFKRAFIENASESGYHGPVKQHVDLIMRELTRDKNDSMPFYFSDMIPIGGNIVNTEDIYDEDQEYFTLSKTYYPTQPSFKAVQVYINGEQLVYGRDYEFNDEGFVRIFAPKKSRDIVEVYEYDNTSGSYVPPTPTKLGLYPKYEPQFYIDDTVQIKPYFDNDGPFKVYAEGAPTYEGAGKIGWYFPVYTDIDDAKDADTRNGGNGEFSVHRFVGMNTTFFMPKSKANIAAQDNMSYEEWTEGQAVIQGHDGSKIAAFKDYRDALILEMEKRIYNNLKIEYDAEMFDVYGLKQGLFRKEGIPKADIDNAMINDFLSWAKLINRQYTDHVFIDRSNTFTFNYNETKYPNGETLPGWWREVYNYAYDTDRPHTHPWEMLGFTIKPSWWDARYGVYPYTNNNWLMWEDIENGIIREPKFRIDKRFVRPGLRKHLPVDQYGRLLSPQEANIIRSYDYNAVEKPFQFGDGSPVESAWRRSSEFPFSVIKGCIINRPQKTFATAFDRIRQIRNSANQIVYSETQQPLQLDKVVYPPSISESNTSITSGLINYIVEYRSILTQETYAQYRSDMERLTNQLSFKIGGFTDKSKFKLILDSRSPLNEGNIFIPEENYTIALSTSFPVLEYVYSGVILEKQPEGFYVKGYDVRHPVFTINRVVPRESDIMINVGGVSEHYLLWGEVKTYAKDTIVKFDGSFYRCSQTHVSTRDFDDKLFVKLPTLPVVGGVDAQVRTRFEPFTEHVNYGTLLPTVQDVVDFLLGYGHYLESLGFKFEMFNESAYEVSDWLYASKQFMFWFTQNWDAGALITLSPGADKVVFNNQFASVSNVYDTSIGYSVLRADGTPLKDKYLKITRDRDNNFSIRTSNTQSGIYSIRIPLVLKEHVVMIDNKTVFNDVIYDLPAGYRQERIKVLGYRTDGWNGSLNIPGFIYDAARVTDWKEWKDYAIGDMVKYKEFFYIANEKVLGSTSFVSESWTRLDDKPEPQLYANFDYRVDQFGDFYDLDSDNLDTEQQRMAQHLIGYQKRKYLQNIINNDVSQYKFYQGMIQEKGTRNALTKLFDVLSGTETDSLEFFEEWAIKNAQYGAADGFEEVEYLLEETQFRLVPQPVLLTDQATGKETDLIYRIRKHETYLKPENYNHKPFPKKYVYDTYTRNSGYVYPSDVSHIIGRYNDLISIDFDSIKADDYVWVGNVENDWDVYQYKLHDLRIESVTPILGETFRFNINLNGIPNDINTGDVIAIFDIQHQEYTPHEDSTIKLETTHSKVQGFFIVSEKSLTQVTLDSDTDTVTEVTQVDMEFCTGLLAVFKSVRVSSVEDLSNMAEYGLKLESKIWIDDDGENRWSVVERDENISIEKAAANPAEGYNHNFGETFGINKNNTIMAVGSPNNENGKVYVYSRSNQTRDWKLSEVLEPPKPLVADVGERFGASVDISANGKYIIVGSPNASYVKTNSVGIFDENLIYDQGQVVEHNESFWEAVIDVRRSTEHVEFKSFHNTNEQLQLLDLDDDDDPPVNMLLAGNYPLDRLPASHFLVRLPMSMYKGIKEGDRIKTKWNTLTNANQTQVELTPREPFNGEIPYINSDYLNSWHEIKFKVDVILQVKNLLSTPPVGSMVSSTNGVGRISYLYNDAGHAVIYLNEVIGTFEDDGLLVTNDAIIGDYNFVGPDNSDNLNISENYGGYVFVETAEPYDIEFTNREGGRGLLITDVHIKGTAEPTNEYYNVMDNVKQIEHPTSGTVVRYGDNTEASMIRVLSCQGTRLVNAGLFQDEPITLPYFAVRAPKSFTDIVQKGDRYSSYYNTLKKTVTVLKVRNTRYTLPPLVYEGETLTQLNSGAYATVFSSEVRVAAETTDPANPIYDIYVQLLSPHASFDKVNELEGSRSGQLYIRPVFEPVIDDIVELDSIGISLVQFNNDNNETEVWDVWDGFIDYSEEYYSFEGLPYVPKSTMVYNGFGDFNVTGNPPHVIRQMSTGATAEVMFLQRLSEKTVRAYVKNVSGNWGVGSKYGANDELEMLEYPGGIDEWGRQQIFDIPRQIGNVVRTSLGYEPAGIGKMIIFRSPVTFDIVLDEETGLQRDELVGQEYWFFTNDTAQGVLHMSNIPNSASSVWKEVYSVIATQLGTPSTYINEGLCYVYQKFGNNFVLDRMIVAPRRGTDEYFGANVKLKQIDIDSYRGYVLAKAGEKNYESPGRIYFLKQGEEEGVFYNWEYAKDKKFKGFFDENETYFVRDIIYLDTRLYKARTNILPGPYDPEYWEEVDSLIDYVGYVPNDLSYTALVGDDQSSRLDLEKLYNFGTVYDVTDDGEVLAVGISYAFEPNVVAIYRIVGGQYIWNQNIIAPNEKSGFGESISINKDGTTLVIGAPYDDTDDHDQGQVFVYKQIDGVYEITQVLVSPAREALEMFGISVSIDGKNIAVGALNGDVELPTTIDEGLTTFDVGFTNFSYVKKDRGVVHVYEKYSNEYVYGDYVSYTPVNEEVEYDNYGFGKNIKFINNHIYVGVPEVKRTEYSNGAVAEYYKTNDYYKILRSPKETVDVEKLKRIMLYDTKSNLIIKHLDYIDPLQGKFPGLADENLSFKLYYDPAVYTTENRNPYNVTVDANIAWGRENVGKLWWDLTNARYHYPYQEDVTFSTNNWSKTFESNSVDVYEWVESDILPSDWDLRADSLEGLALGISGTSKYGDDVYVESQEYDSVAQVFTKKYYFWVKDKRIKPAIEGRTMHSGDVADLLEDPAGFGYPFVSMISEDSFAVYNSHQYLKDKNIAISFQYWTIKNQNINIHNEYQILSENLAISVPRRDIESKWIDSLVGYDKFGRTVPDPQLDPKYRYGTLNEPRQGWFVNRIEALKQYIERVNYVLKQYLIVDSKNLTKLKSEDPYPSKISRLYDISLDLRADLDLYGTSRIDQASAQLEIVDGEVAAIRVTNPGRGYLTSPSFVIHSRGTGAEIDFELSSTGAITRAIVVNGGKDYHDDAEIEIRKFTALIVNDETIDGKWALYERDKKANSWKRMRSQGFNVNLYWDYIDWYAEGYNELTNTNHMISYAYELPSVKDEIGETVKINNIGSGGWLLLKKIDDQNDVDYTVNYETIGREKGTIEFANSLYDPFAGLVNFDVINYDTTFYDGLPSTEIRYIAQAIKEDIFVEELAVEYNKLFFAAIRYVLTESTSVDWLFKTSFIRAKHNVGELREDITFNNDNLASYQDYIKEVKAFKSKIREYISSYEKVDNTQSRITDFDLPPYYDAALDKIVPHTIKSWDDRLIGAQFVDVYPNKNWYDNSAYVVTEVRIIDPGHGYQSPPQIILSGGGGYGAEVKTHLGANGSVRLVEIIDEGKGYYSLPTVTINGSLEEGGSPVILSVVIGRALPRSTRTEIKFDRITSEYHITNLEESEELISSGSQYVFNLTWPMNLERGRTSVRINDIDLLTSEFTYSNILDTSKGYDRYHGQITLTAPPEKYTKIYIEYVKDPAMLTAADRINLYYNPEIGQFGKDLAQLMDGVDYGGVEVKSFNFGNKVGWDTEDWYTNAYDSYDLTFTDQSYKVVPHLRYFDALGYKIYIRWTNIAKAINAMVTGNSANMKLNFIDLFSVDLIGDEISNMLDPHSILNIANDYPQMTFKSAEHIQKYVLGTLDNPVALQNIEDQLLPRFAEFTEEELHLLIEEGILEEVTFTTQSPLEDGQVYNFYHNGIRLDDANYGTGSETNPNAVMLPITGAGEVVSILIRELGIDPEVDDMFTIRKPTSDGSFLPSDVDYDTMLSGGNLDYANARGILPEDIVVDGDNFITPMTSKGPEENVPGHLADTLDITVFDRPTAGVSTLTSRNFTTDGTTKIYPIGSAPLTPNSLLVKVDGKLKKLKTDYKINSTDKTIEFVRKPRANRKVNLITIDYSGTDILDVDTIKGDGVTTAFYVNVRWTEDVSAQVTVNAEEYDYVLEQSNDPSYPTPDNVLIKFAVPPPVDAVIRYAIFKGDEGMYSTVTVDSFIAEVGTDSVSTNINQYQLSRIPSQQEPVEWHTMVLINGNLLNPGYVESIVLTDVLEYRLKLYQVPISSVSVKQIRVFLNDHELEHIKEWSYSSLEEINPLLKADQQEGSLIKLEANVGQPGDVMKVYVTGLDTVVESGGDYRYGYFDLHGEFVSTPGILHISKPHDAGDEVVVYQFSNHDSQGIDWQSFDIEERTALRQGYIESSAIFIVSHPTADITLDFELEYNQRYSVTLNDIRIDDINFGTDIPVTNPFAKMQPIVGNGTNLIRLPDIGPFIKENDYIRIEKIGEEIQHDASSKDWYEFRLLQNGFVPLNKPAIEEYYVWVAVNGKMLDPSVDYHLTRDKKYIKIARPLLTGDNVQTIHFSNRPQSGKLGWRQFKDILNRTHYTIIDGAKNITLAEDLNWYDKTIELVDATHLPNPGTGAKNPGVVFINKERVEYFEKVNNRLQQLRRGTLGTGVSGIVPAGTEVYNQSVTMMLPYKDETITTQFIADGESNTFPLDFVPNSVNEFEVYVANKRLRKTELESYQLDTELREQYSKDGQLVAQDSPEGDVTLPAEFTLEGSDVVLLETPEKNQRVYVIRRQGAVWTEEGKDIGESDTLIAKMIKSVQVDLPR